MRRRDRERGSVTIWIVTIAFASIMMVGLAVDLGGKVAAQQHARDVAAQAARAGGQRLNGPVAVRGDGAKPDGADAVVAARAYLASAGVSASSVTVSGTRLVVRVTDTYQPKFLQIIGLGTMTVHGQGSARLVQVIDGEEAR